MREAVLVSAARTPFGKFGGLLRDFSAVDLGSRAVTASMKRIGLDPAEVDELYMGVAVLAVTASVAARQILFTAGLPPRTPSLTIDRACCSSMTCVGLGLRNIRSGEIHTALCGGMEAMSQTPLVARGARWGVRLGGIMLEEPLFLRNPILNVPLAVGAGDVALQYGVGREEQDLWALGSHQKFFCAMQAGKFAEEIHPVEIRPGKGPGVTMDRDEAPRADTTIEKLRGLPTVYGSKTVTAGNAPGLNDGASALILMSRERQEHLRIAPLAKILTHVNVAGDPLASPYLPAHAIARALEKTGRKLTDLKRIEINEAFAATPLVSTKVLSTECGMALDSLRSITNVNGGAVAIGHPTGASGGRIIMTLAYELRRSGGGLGAAAICGGYGQSDAVIVEVE
ncbi:MAG TPA: thiolase family protein [Thermodesulfobacteriota bacterium]|nr:thiolase family protein [Thermodesulfobacteriota bacterium]